MPTKEPSGRGGDGDDTADDSGGLSSEQPGGRQTDLENIPLNKEDDTAPETDDERTIERAVNAINDAADNATKTRSGGTDRPPDAFTDELPPVIDTDSIESGDSFVLRTAGTDTLYVVAEFEDTDTNGTRMSFEPLAAEDRFVINGVPTRRVSPPPRRDGIVYINSTAEAEAESGWYDVDGASPSRGADGRSEYAATAPDGTTVTLTRRDLTDIYVPERYERPRHDQGEPWKQFETNPAPPTDAALEAALPDDLETPVLDEDLTEWQRDQLRRGLKRTGETGALDSVDRVVGSEDAPEDFFDRGKASSALGRFDFIDNLVGVNTDEADQERYENAANKRYVGGTLRHTLYHEVVHAAHTTRIYDEEDEQALLEMMGDFGESFDGGERAAMKRKVSGYAGRKPVEAVAEIGTAILSCESVDDAAMYVYEKYRGPDF